MTRRQHLARACCLAVLAPAAFVAPPDVADRVSATPWQMHTIQEGTGGIGSFDGSDGVDLRDITGDGFPEVTSAYEQGHRVSVSLHPGGGADPTAPWETLDLPLGDRLVGAEDAVFGDVDGDGGGDVIVATEGTNPKVSVLFGPPDHSDPPTESEWTKVDVEASIGTKAMRVALADMNGDGIADILVGGKESSSTAAGLGYYSPPADPRQATGWTYHPITPVGWVMQMMAVDVDGDDDLDVLYSDRDPIDVGVPAADRSRMGVRWWENAGGPNPTWRPHQITPDRERFHKWFSFLDWNGDGLGDVVDCRSDTAEVNALTIWLNHGVGTSWTAVPGPNLVDAGVGRCQHVTATHVDSDDALDVAATFSHAEGASGVVWWKNHGTSSAPVWERHEISGSALGVKYDNLAWADLDRDGDLDAVTSEQHEDTDEDGRVGPGLGVIWYENPAVGAGVRRR
jgi:FG-GAP-like repeat